MDLSIIIPAHNSDPTRLRRTLRALGQQELGMATSEIILVDNASLPALSTEVLGEDCPPNLRIVEEAELGLSHARARGFTEAKGSVIVLVDDDNVIAPGYLVESLAFLREHPGIGAVGGKVFPEFEIEPSPELAEFSGLLALRDHGDGVLIAMGFHQGQARDYPLFAPLGAGMALTREAARVWLKHFKEAGVRLSDRRGNVLSSSGDNDIVLSMMVAGYGVAYLPSLVLTHLIPSQRVQPAYLERLNFGIQKSWMQVLALHHACPWPALTPLGCKLRQLRAWFRMEPWRSNPARIRFAGACGHFAGRVKPS